MEKLRKEELDAAEQKAIENDDIIDVIGNKIEIKDSLPPLRSFVEGQEVELNPLPFEIVRQVVFGLQGRVLTVLEATYENPEKLKATKSLVKDAFSQSANWLMDLSIRDFEQIPEKE